MTMRLHTDTKRGKFGGEVIFSSSYPSMIEAGGQRERRGRYERPLPPNKWNVLYRRNKKEQLHFSVLFFPIIRLPSPWSLPHYSRSPTHQVIVPDNDLYILQRQQIILRKHSFQSLNIFISRSITQNSPLPCTNVPTFEPKRVSTPPWIRHNVVTKTENLIHNLHANPKSTIPITTPFEERPK